jgi:CBS domain containing-hemolysin-like protein
VNSNFVYGIIIAVCVVLSAFFSCTETAFSCANRIRLKSYADSGNKRALTALWVTDNYDKVITAILIGNNVVNLGCSSIATVLCMNLFGNSGAAIATGATTLLVLTFGEIIPKCFGKEVSDTIALYTAGIMKFLVYALLPLVYLFTALKSVVLKLAHIKKDQPSVTEDELKYIIDSIEEEGILEEQEKDLVQSALDFDEKTALEILTPRVDVVLIDAEDEVQNIKDIIFKERYSRIPVYEGSIDNIIGILQTRDYLEKLVECENPDIKELVTSTHFIYKTRKLSDILADFKEKKLHMAIVTDEYGGMLGIVTMEDLLEEIVGDIWDEDEDEERTYTKLKDGRYIISGDMDLSDLFEIFEINEDDDIESISVGGFIIEQLGTIPTVNESVEYKDIRITVKRVKNNRIISAFVSKIEE